MTYDQAKAIALNLKIRDTRKLLAVHDKLISSGKEEDRDLAVNARDRAMEIALTKPL